MQRKATKPGKRAAPVARNDLEILHPERELTLDDHKIVMREYRFLEGLRIQQMAEPVIASLAALAMQREQVDLERLESVLTEHADIVIQLMAIACDQDPAWIAELNDSDGKLLFNIWWLANTDFFTRRVKQRVELRMLQALRSQNSTPPSSPTGTQPNGSATTHAAN